MYKLTAHEIKALIDQKEITSEEITRAYLDRIDAVEDKVGAYITISAEQAIDQAKAVDAKIAKGEKLGALAGVPIAIKDNICTKGILTSCASKMLENFIAPYDATVVSKMKSQDVVMLGKLNMDEFAMGSSTENSAVKITKNPWNTKYVPGGSSGGSAAAVAADMAAFTLGSDTGGSIRQPASYCGVVGMKPTYGTVSRFGLVAFASSLDQIGPLTKDVKDMALALNMIMGHDKMDSSSAQVEYDDLSKYVGQEVKGMKVALPKEFLGEGVQPEVKKAILDSVKVLESQGMTVEEVSMDMTDMALPAYYLISSAEASSNLARFDGIKYGYRAKEFDNLIDLYKQTRDEAFGDEVKRRIMLGTYALSSGYYDAYYKKAQQVRTLIKEEFSKLFADYDIVLTPTCPTTAFEIGMESDNPIEMYLNDICTVPINIAGVPALSINAGFDDKGLPIGIQFIGNVLQEGTILKAAYAYEQARTLPGGANVEL